MHMDEHMLLAVTAQTLGAVKADKTEPFVKTFLLLFILSFYISVQIFYVCKNFVCIKIVR